jgi:hypothetical protein
MWHQQLEPVFIEKEAELFVQYDTPLNSSPSGLIALQKPPAACVVHPVSSALLLSALHQAFLHITAVWAADAVIDKLMIKI